MSLAITTQLKTAKFEEHDMVCFKIGAFRLTWQARSFLGQLNLAV